jgi:multiple sugar transport system substrate-binding protein
MKIQRWLRPVLLGCLAAFLLGACGGQKKAAGADGPVNISFYTYNYMNQQKAGVDQLITDFNAENPNITVEIIQTSATDSNSKIWADLAAGIIPDVIQITFDSLDYAVNNYGVQDLNRIVPKAHLDEHLAGFYPAALEVAKLDGHLYGLPYTFSTPVLFYNASIFEEAGLDPDNPPSTWAEVETAGLQIVKKTGKDGFVFGATTAYDMFLQGLIRSNGGRALSEDRKTITFGETPSVEAVAMLQSMRQKGAHAAMNDLQGGEAFMAGNLGMMLTTAAYQVIMLAAAEAGGWELRTAKMPSFGNKPAVPTNSGSGLLICSKDPAKQLAAWRFIKHVTSDRGYTIITTMMGYPPLRPNVIADERYLKTWAEENPLVQPNLEQIEIVTPWQSYPGSNWQQIEGILMDALNKCIFTDADVRQTLQAAQRQAQSLMPRS